MSTIVFFLAHTRPPTRPGSATVEDHQPDGDRDSASYKNVEKDQRLSKHVPGGPGGSAEGRLHGDDDPAVGHAVRQRSVQVAG